MGRLVLLFIVVVLAVVFIHWLLKEDPKKVAQYLRRGTLWFAIVAIVLLAATGRLNWIFAAVAAALPFLGRILSLLRFVPILSQLYSHIQSSRAAGAYQSGGPAKMQTSQVNSRFLRMTLEHDSGKMDGEILEGELKGKRLSELDLPQLQRLLRQYKQQDDESFALLEAYLDRVYGEDWREPGAEQGHTISDGPMSEQEAREILGVTAKATDEEITNAHRRLMQKLHPDRGGSTYLAAKINQAKDLLLGSRT
ncbi:MAG: DnaJ domain-containing protein [Arenicellales bacterium]|nr:DnaJ domain-containing protein [Arenicellales bacterium]